MEKQDDLARVGAQLAEIYRRRASLGTLERAVSDAAARLVGEAANILGGHQATKIIMDAAEDVDPAAVEWLDRQWGDFL